MKRLIFIYAFFISAQVFGFGEYPKNLYLKVKNPAGTTLHEQPNEKSPVLTVVHFQTEFKIECPRYGNCIFLKEGESWNNTPGGWYKVIFEEKEGYIFSGDVIKISIEKLRPEFTLAMSKSDYGFIQGSEYYWYALFYDTLTQTSKFKPVWIGQSANNYCDEDLKVGYELHPGFFHVKTHQGLPAVLLGVRDKPINLDSVKGKFWMSPKAKFHNKYILGKFLYPDETIEFAKTDSQKYYLRGYERPVPSKGLNQTQKRERQYQLFYSFSKKDYRGVFSNRSETIADLIEGTVCPPIEDFQFRIPYPRVLWRGDLNEDGFPDLIVVTHAGKFSHGDNPLMLNLFVSEKMPGGWFLNKKPLPYSIRGFYEWAEPGMCP